MRLSLYPVLASLCLVLPLAACDEPADKTAQEETMPAETAVTPSAGAADTGEALPEAAVPVETESVTSDSSMAEESPAGEGVTAEEIPHSDVPPPSREVFTDAECDFEEWVGKDVTEAEAAAKETGRPTRILKPDSMMTMDHAPDRINVVHDDDGKVTRVWCG